ncbi:MAG: efflux RND transporter permease subunit, partial [Verrucomicrobiota bacterium]
PTVWPDKFQALNSVQVDTDPENMLSKDEAVRIFHNDMKDLFALNDMVVVGIVNEKDQDGVFNPASLERIYELTEYAKRLRWTDEETGESEGVIEVDVIAPSTVDNVESGGIGSVKFEWLMSSPPETREEALAVKQKAERLPFLNGTLLSEDGEAIALYLPLTSKDLSHKIYTELKEKIAEFNGDDQFYITGLPVAEDTFGYEMFIQMAISAPLAMLAIFILMLIFFRKLSLIISPLIVAMISVTVTMSLLVISGQTIHIMSSMIPIFIMPIAVLDSVHILSMFFDRYPQIKERRETMMTVMDALFMPMLYTSLTSAAGFASLALAPIPPVQVFGLFCAFGIIVAWLLTITFIPAFITFLPEKWLARFGAKDHEHGGSGILSRILRYIGAKTYSSSFAILAVTVVVVIIAVYGIFQIQINDNPIKWFEKSHPIRVADTVLNEHFGGTYMAYLALEAGEEFKELTEYKDILTEQLNGKIDEYEDDSVEAGVFRELREQVESTAEKADSVEGLLEQLGAYADRKMDEEDSDELYYAWDDASIFIEEIEQDSEVFKDPEVLAYINDIQEHLADVEDPEGEQIIGKSNSLTDIVKTVYRSLRGGKDEYFRIPESRQAVAQSLLQYQSGHNPNRLWHFVTPDYKNAAVWFQLKSGDNIQMERVADAFRQFKEQNTAPAGIESHWFGLTYINVVWQEKMVSGMLFAFLGSFLVVFLMMTILFRSALWGLLCMIPLTVTIALIYGSIGIIGKDYDMPVAVLSALALGLAVDFAIHFLEHSRVLRFEQGAWESAAPLVFGDPARAIVRNIIVIAVGFLPLLAAPLVPYQTVGVFLAAILAVSGIATLFILPALIRLLEPFLFPKTRPCCIACNSITCLAVGLALAALIMVNLQQFLDAEWTSLTLVSLAVIPVMMIFCRVMSNREKCNLNEKEQANPSNKEETQDDEK